MNAGTRASLILVAIAVFFALLRAEALSATEYCPATVVELAPATEAASFTYRLQALSTRDVDATIVAETNRGWFAWKPGRVALSGAFARASTAGTSGGSFAARSEPLAVSFHEPVTIRYAWVRSAKTDGDAEFGWDEAGNVACDPPDFDNPDPEGFVAETLFGQDAAPSPHAAPARKTRAPYALTHCDRAFAGTSLVESAKADFPAKSAAGLLGHRFSTAVEVAVDDLGTPTDAWVTSTSGFNALDAVATKAALASSYSPARAYCRNVRGFYFLRADFTSQGASVTPM